MGAMLSSPEKNAKRQKLEEPGKADVEKEQGESAGKAEESPVEDTAAVGSPDPQEASQASSDVEASPPPRKRKVLPFSLKELEAEIEALRADMPPFVNRVGHLTVPNMVEEKGHMVANTGEGPWDLIVALRGEEGDKAYGHYFNVRLRFDTDLWPSHIPIVRFQGVFHHALTTESGGFPMQFYKGMLRDERDACTVRLSLQSVHNFLVDPLAALKLPKDLPPQLGASVRMHRSLNEERFEAIEKYAKQVVHPELFASPPELKEAWFEPSFWKAVQENTPEGWRSILEEHLPGEVFSFRIFTQEFCKTLLDEIFNFYESGLPARRPNSMNNYGIILNEIGLEPLIDRLQEALQPLGNLLWPGPGSVWDGQHCFIVRYREGEDLGLDMHTDDSDVTFNICLGLEFDGAGLQFCGLMGAPNHRKHTYTYKHVKGTCVCHLGRKRHGADDISTGERLNLILWNHSSTYRLTDEYDDAPYSREEGPPDAVCVSYTHDRDYGLYKEYPAGKEKHKGRGWCPRKGFEYKGFEPDADVEIAAS